MDTRNKSGQDEERHDGKRAETMVSGPGRNAVQSERGPFHTNGR